MTDRMFRSSIDPDLAIDPDEVGRVVEELFPEALGAWVYGRVATGSARRDIDIAVLPDRPMDAWDGHERAVEVGFRLRRDVDLVDLNAVPPVLRYEIFTDGVRVAARDPRACAFFETTAISMYQRLNVERKEVFGDIRRRGTVY